MMKRDVRFMEAMRAHGIQGRAEDYVNLAAAIRTAIRLGVESDTLPYRLIREIWPANMLAPVNSEELVDSLPRRW